MPKTSHDRTQAQENVFCSSPEIAEIRDQIDPSIKWRSRKEHPPDSRALRRKGPNETRSDWDDTYKIGTGDHHQRRYEAKCLRMVLDDSMDNYEYHECWISERECQHQDANWSMVLVDTQSDSEFLAKSGWWRMFWMRAAPLMRDTRPLPTPLTKTIWLVIRLSCKQGKVHFSLGTKWRMARDSVRIIVIIISTYS